MSSRLGISNSGSGLVWGASSALFTLLPVGPLYAIITTGPTERGVVGRYKSESFGLPLRIISVKEFDGKADQLDYLWDVTREGVCNSI